ncbi:MAG: NADH-quinone oxidoreductase subunit N [Actinomycetota bacterium]
MNPVFDWHALAPDIVLAGTIVAVLIASFVLSDRDSVQVSRIALVGTLGALIPIVTLAEDGADREMFGGAYAVDNYALALKAFFVVATYIALLLSIDYIEDGDYYRSEFYFLLLTSTLGMSVMVSSRDLISLFVALEMISIPTFVLAAYRKHDRVSNEAGVKYYLIGVLSSALMLYGMSLIYGLTGSTLLSEINVRISAIDGDQRSLLAIAIFLSLVGFAFKVSAVPFHFWAPDTYEGAPTPVTAYLSVLSKAGGFVALLNIVFFGFRGAAGAELWWPVVWVLAAASMTIGNLAALRQTNIVRMLAYSSVAQGGFMLVPFAAAGIASADGDLEVAGTSFEAVIIYLLVYGAMNLGAFAVVIALARRTRTADISSYAGLFQTAPALALAMTMFMASLAGIPPVAGWFAKFAMFRSVLEAGNAWAVALAVVAAVNSVIAFYYYAGVIRSMWFHDPASEDRTPIRIPPALTSAIAVTAAVTLAIGVYPQWFAKVGELAIR